LVGRIRPPTTAIGRWLEPYQNWPPNQIKLVVEKKNYNKNMIHFKFKKRRETNHFWLLFVDKDE
jgi:hypothetical protein